MRLVVVAFVRVASGHRLSRGVGLSGQPTTLSCSLLLAACRGRFPGVTSASPPIHAPQRPILQELPAAVGQALYKSMIRLSV